MTGIKDNNMQSQQLQHGEFRVDSDPDGFKSKMQKRSDFVRFKVRNIFYLIVIAIGVVIYIAAK